MTINRLRATSSDFGLYKELKANKKKCLLIICGASVASILFILTICYLSILLNEVSQIPNSVGAANAQSNYNTRHSGRPFEVKVIGVPPQKFTPTPSTLPPTTKKSTTLKYPQLNYYSQHHYPKSIQEVIDYVTDKPLDKNFINIGEEIRNPTFSETQRDNFHSFKPGDPSEVNLLATGSVRFAPPIWRNFKSFNQKPIPIHSYVNISNLQMPNRIPRLAKNFFPHRFPDNTDVLATVKKPVMVSINIAPMENNVKRYPYQDFVKKEAMTLNLKVYPDMTYFDEEEKKGYKNK